MQKRERLERTIAGEPTDRSPVALWRHFPGDDLRAADLAQAVIEDQRRYDWDIVNILPASTFQTLDYNVQERWDGTPDGQRTVTKRAIQRSLDWTELRPLDSARGAHGRQIDCTRLVAAALGEETPILLTVYSPLTQADMLAGYDQLLLHLRTQPDRLKSGLNALTENLLRFLDTLRKLPLAGICLVIRHADYSLLSEDEYRAFGLAYDRRILESAPQRWWLRALRIEGTAPMLRTVSSLPAQVMQWCDREGEPDIAFGKSLCTGAVCGGLASERDLYLGTPATVRDTARASLEKANHRRMILSSGSPLVLASPLSNIRAARAAVEPVTA